MIYKRVALRITLRLCARALMIDHIVFLTITGCPLGFRELMIPD